MSNKIGGEKILVSREGAAEGGFKGEFRRARAFRRSEAEAVSSVQKMFEQSCIIPPRWKSQCLAPPRAGLGGQIERDVPTDIFDFVM
jgi:hypothetical protein